MLGLGPWTSPNRIKLNGFGDGTDGIQIKIDFKGFEYVEPVATLINVENYNGETALFKGNLISDKKQIF